MTPELRFPQIIDNTIRSDFVRCPHYWFRRHCQGLVPEAPVSVHLHFGACFARGLQATRWAYYADGAPSNEAQLSGQIAAVREWGDWQVDPRTTSEALKTLPGLLDALDEYFKRYPLESDALTPIDIGGETGVLIEKTFAVEIPGTEHPDTGEPILYGGRCDMVARNRESDTIWIVDEKTTTRLGTSWIDKWALHSQPTGYVWGYRSYGINPSGAIMRGIGILTSSVSFAESIQPRAPWKVDQWLSQLQHNIEDMCRAYRQYEALLYAEEINLGNRPDLESVFSRALGDACHAYNYPCAYLPLCNSPDPDRWLSEYSIRYWQPLTLGEPSK